jgi:hypothetical protein
MDPYAVGITEDAILVNRTAPGLDFGRIGIDIRLRGKDEGTRLDPDPRKAGAEIGLIACGSISGLWGNGFL